MSTAALNNLWIYIQSMALSDRNKQWLADRLIESKTKSSQQKAEEYLQQRCSANEYAELMETDFLNKPYPPFCNQTEEEIMHEIEEGEKEGYLSVEETAAWLNKLAAL